MASGRGSKERKQKMRDKVTYLSFVESNVGRMANCSVAIKGLCCALLTGLVALFQQPCTSMPRFLLEAGLLLVVGLFLAALDANYLKLERLNRRLYADIDANNDGSYSTDMGLPDSCKDDRTRWCDCFFSWSVFGFYLPATGVAIAADAIVCVGGAVA